MLTGISCQAINPLRWAGLGQSAGSGVIASDQSGSNLAKSGQAEQTGVEMLLDLPVQAASVIDTNTADVYLTDLSLETLERIAQGDAGSEVSGTLIHVHVFLNPRPGRTPIEPTAASATVRTVIIARGQIGVYDGAGFTLPGGSLKKGNASGRIRDAQTRLTRATEGFNDLLGPGRISLSFAARGEQAQADRIARVVRALTDRAEPVD